MKLIFNVSQKFAHLQQWMGPISWAALRAEQGPRAGFPDNSLTPAFWVWVITACHMLTWQPAATHQTAACSPLAFPPQWDGEEKWAKGETRGLT